MSDYGDDYSDDGGEWFYVEDEYMAADDLAEHAVASPPPTTYGDEDMMEEWDRFDYFNDLDYASDGYDNVTFEVQSVKEAKTGQKRKRALSKSHSKKRRATASDATRTADTSRLEHSPIVWRTQAERDIKPRLVEDDAPSYALLKNWREKLGNTPRWARGSPSPKEEHAQPAKPGRTTSATVQDLPLPQVHMDEEDMEECEDEEQDGAGISQEALMAALQRQLAAAGGPLSGMDPQQLLEFAMRMASGQDEGEDIAGEMADAMLGGEDEENDEDAEEKLLSWVAQQRNTNTEKSESRPKSPEDTGKSRRLPTPPSSEANRSVHISETTTKAKQSAAKGKGSLKRKAEDDDDEQMPTKVTRKRVQKSFDAPTAASQAKAPPVRATRSSARTKRS